MPIRPAAGGARCAWDVTRFQAGWSACRSALQHRQLALPGAGIGLCVASVAYWYLIPPGQCIPGVMHAPGQVGRSKPAHGAMCGLYHMPGLLLASTERCVQMASGLGLGFGSNKSDCTALEPLANKLAEVYEPCSTLVRQTDLMEGLGSTYSENYDIRPRRKEGLED